MENDSNNNLKMLNTFLMIFVGIYFIFIKVKMETISRRMTNIKSITPLEKKSLDISSTEKDIKKIKKGFLFSIIAFGIIILFNYINLFKSKYINTSIAHYEQLKKASLPYITKQELNQYESSFSLIKRKQDYEIIIKNLNEVINKNNLYINESTIW